MRDIIDRVVFDMVDTKIALQLEGDDAKIMAENLGLVDKHETTSPDSSS